jgi:hypothetical protein
MKKIKIIAFLLVCGLMNAQNENNSESPVSYEQYFENLSTNDKACFVNGVDKAWHVIPNELATGYPEEIHPEAIPNATLPSFQQLTAMPLQEVALPSIYDWEAVIGDNDVWEGYVGNGKLKLGNHLLDGILKYMRITKFPSVTSDKVYQVYYAWYTSELNKPIVEIEHLVLLNGNMEVTEKKIVNRLKEISKSSYMKLSPNPAEDHVNISLINPLKEKAKVKIITLSGVILREVEFNKEKQNFSLDVKALKSGFYIIEIYEGDIKRGTKNLIVKR